MSKSNFRLLQACRDVTPEDIGASSVHDFAHRSTFSRAVRIRVETWIHHHFGVRAMLYKKIELPQDPPGKGDSFWFFLTSWSWCICKRFQLQVPVFVLWRLGNDFGDGFSGRKDSPRRYQKMLV